jgi:hypothetical protein
MRQSARRDHAFYRFGGVSVSYQMVEHGVRIRARAKQPDRWLR